jgi:hypothetical protein
MPRLALKPNNFMQPDYDLIYYEDDGRKLVVGRIFLARETGPASTERPWSWLINLHQQPGRTPPCSGLAVTFEEARAACKRCWESSNVPLDWPPSLRRREDSKSPC